MTRIARAAAAVLCAAATACGGGEDADGRTGAADQPDATGQPGREAALPVTPIADPTQVSAAGNLSPVNNSGVSGSVNVRGLGEQTEIALNVTGVTAGNRQLRGAVVQGTCERGGAEVAAIGPIPVGAGNIAALTDTIPVPVGSILDGGHALAVRGQAAGPATPPLACSPLPRWEDIPPT